LPSLDNTAKTVTQGTDIVLEYLRMNRSGNVLEISRQLMMSVHRIRSIFDILESDGKILTMGIGAKRTAFYIRSEVTENLELPEYGMIQIRLPAPVLAC
ncbi:MAG: hypothetical protein IKQ93_00055, partial [Candidatus Methanomethylophilaceae archaeon]|nr:hypothetical protein [Candidatus Methanomethylophilaceae archaeon]